MEFGGSHSRGALEGLQGLGGHEGGPRLLHGTAAPEAVPIYRHHKTPRAGACFREGGVERAERAAGGDTVSDAQALLQLPGRDPTPSQATLAPCPICSGTPVRVDLTPLSSYIPLLPRHMHWTLDDSPGGVRTYLPTYLPSSLQTWDFCQVQQSAQFLRTRLREGPRTQSLFRRAPTKSKSWACLGQPHDLGHGPASLWA